MHTFSGFFSSIVDFVFPYRPHFCFGFLIFCSFFCFLICILPPFLALSSVRVCVLHAYYTCIMLYCSNDKFFLSMLIFLIRLFHLVYESIICLFAVKGNHSWVCVNALQWEDLYPMPTCYHSHKILMALPLYACLCVHIWQHIWWINAPTCTCILLLQASDTRYYHTAGKFWLFQQVTE